MVVFNFFLVMFWSLEIVIGIQDGNLVAGGATEQPQFEFSYPGSRFKVNTAHKPFLNPYLIKFRLFEN